MYSITIKNLTGKQMLALVDVIPHAFEVQLKRDGQTVLPSLKGKKRGARVEPGVLIMLGDVKPKPGTRLATVCDTLEKMEAKGGVGNYARTQLTAKCRKIAGLKGPPGAIITQAITLGMIKRAP
jgi:hypothetical protein